jgi:hypothetical protein
MTRRKGEDEGSGGDVATPLIGRPGKNEIVLVHKTTDDEMEPWLASRLEAA